MHNRQSLSAAINELKNLRIKPRRSYKYPSNVSNQNKSIQSVAEKPTSRYYSVPESIPSNDYFSKSTCSAKPDLISDTCQTSQGKTLINSIFSSSAYNPKVIRPISSPAKDNSTPNPSISHVHLPDAPTTVSRPTSPRYTATPTTDMTKSGRLSSRRSKRARITSARSNCQNALKKFPSEKIKNHVHFSAVSIQHPPSQNDANKYHKFGVHLLYDTNERKRASVYLKKSADLGNVKAALLYGTMLKDGDGVEKDDGQAAHYLKIAADAGIIDAMRNYALMCKTGSGVEYSMNEAVRYFQAAADLGDMESARQIVKILENGFPFLLGRRESAKYYKMLADKGDADALSKYNAIVAKFRKWCWWYIMLRVFLLINFI